MSSTELLDDHLPDATMTQEEIQHELQVIGRRASQLQIENEAWKQEVDELALTNNQQVSELDAQASEIQKFKVEKKKQENYMEKLEQDIREAEKQRLDDVDTRKRLASEVKSSKEHVRELQKQIDVQLNVALGVAERLKKAEALNDWYKQRTETPELGEWLRGMANEQKRTDLKIAELKDAFKSMIQIQEPLPDVMDQEEVAETNFSDRPMSRICESRPTRTLEDELNDTQWYISDDDDGHITSDIQPIQSNDVHSFNKSLEMDIDCGLDDDSASEYSSGYSLQSMVYSDPNTMESYSSIDSSGHPRMLGNIPCLDENTASSSDDVGNDGVQPVMRTVAESISKCGDRKMSFVMHDSLDDSYVNSHAQDMDWEATEWEPRTPEISHTHLKRVRVDIVDGNGCSSENKKQRNNSQKTSPASPYNTEKPILEQITQTTKNTEIASMGVQTDESWLAAVHDIQAVEKPGNPRLSSSPNSVQTVPQEPAKIKHKSQDRDLTEIPGHEIQVVAPREHIRLESIPPSKNGTILLAPLSGTAARVKTRFIEGFKLLTNTDQDEVLPSHQNPIRATPPNLQSDTDQDYPAAAAEPMAIMITDDVYLEHIMQWVEYILNWVNRWTPFLKILMVFLAWLLCMWWTDNLWQWKKANEVPRNIFREVRQSVYELGKYQSVDRVALG